MRRWPMIAAAVVAVAAACAGCASSDRVSPRAVGSGPPTATGSVVPPSSGSAGLPPAGSVTGAPAPAPSVPPSGPGATTETGSPPAPGTHATVAIDGAVVSCPDGAPLVGAPGREGGGPLPSGVSIIAVVRCETVERTYAGSGQWVVQIAEVADSGLGAFVTALHQPSEPRPPDLMCPAYLRATPWFAVVDAAGQVFQPALPTDQCGQPSAKAMLALGQLDYRVVDAVRVRQVTVPEPNTSGCYQHVEGTPMVTPGPGDGTGRVSTPPSRPVCPYSH